MASQVPQESHRSQAVELLLEERRKLAVEIQEIDFVIARLRPNGEAHSSNSGIPPVTPGEYQGMKMTNAFEAYLKKRPGVKIPIDRVVADLEIGGADMGLPKRHRQNLKILMRNRTTLVEWDENWNMQLAPTANEPAKARKKKG